MPTLPGGQIIGGVGGRIWTGNYPTTYLQLQNILSSPSLSQGNNNGLDVSEWRLNIRTNLAQCPHTGTFGANCRRIVLDDWSFSGSVPLDQSHFPDLTLTSSPGDFDSTTHGQNISLVFMLGNVSINPEAIYMGMKTQKYYYAPSAYLQTANPVLNAAGDVIRMSFSGEGCGHIFLLPTENSWCTLYLNYLTNMKWM